MASSISLYMFSYVILYTYISTMVYSDNYIIHMDLSAMPKAFTSHHSWYHSTLLSVLDTNSQGITKNLNSSSSKILYTYTNAMNGFSANLSPSEHESLKTYPGYISSIPDLHVKLHTTHTPQFLGLNPHKGAWKASNFGKDIIVGVVDTGVWPESEMYNDNGLTEIPSKWKGQCEDSISSLCNKKLIGAKFFNKGYLSMYPDTSMVISNSTRDTSGHGTHTSTTAAGSPVDGASYFGYANGSATGMAPQARIAIYKIFWGDDSISSDIIAAIDAAISDGVDVLSLSFGSVESIPLYDDPIAIATFAAMEKEIFVSTAAGNSGRPLHFGSSLKTVSNGIPWVINVAAGTLDREFLANLTLGNGVSVTGLSSYLGNFSTKHFPIIVYMGTCDDVKELVTVKNKIVVCEDKNGSAISQQVGNVYAAKVVGAVFISNGSNFDNDFYSLRSHFASIIIDPMNGEIVKDYIKSSTNTNNTTSTASMFFKVTHIGVKPAPSVDYYSSRGPSKSCPFVLKPDITAPGTNILAAWPSNVPVPLPSGKIDLFSNFNLLTGTSMACPHIAGVGALMKGAHSDWSPAAIRSAIMTTSDIFDNTKKPIKDIGDGYKPASPFALGAGHVNPNRALDPGLVYDVGVQDYVNLLCALNFTQKNIAAITRTSSNNCSNPSLDLNYPSFIAYFSSNDSRTTHEFERVVTNVGERQAIYVGSVSPIEGFSVSVVPNKLVFSEKNEKVRYKLRIERTKKNVKEVGFGYMTWTDLKHVVRSPIVVTTLQF